MINLEALPGSLGYWWLTAYPKIWSFGSFAGIKIGEEQGYTLYNENGNKRRVFQTYYSQRHTYLSKVRAGQVKRNLVGDDSGVDDPVPAYHAD